MSNEIRLEDEVAGLHSIFMFNIELHKESDRGCVLLAASFLDNCLRELLKANCVDDESAFNDICNGSSPFATFSGKIDLSYLLGLISLEAKRYLHIIRKIRNEFAHSMEIIDFNTENVANRCRNLILESFPEDSNSPRSIFITASFGVAGYLAGQTESALKPEVAEDTFGNIEEHEEYINGRGAQLMDALKDKYFSNN
ncbi:hypothetical protein J2W91_003518 [Paenibacillus amylolyticus]|uniref:DUF4145 domain-containing protein n=1 Tax=Paenibacillus amylolyticus TaxID=1451 RepID=A0AAP5LMX6_PAEAM|nr:hypothetical protein [Paenibacillus amylolyticus]MDR6725032.1 hypothetical protein [Paenibacillus amylolyticus]